MQDDSLLANLRRSLHRRVSEAVVFLGFLAARACRSVRHPCYDSAARFAPLPPPRVVHLRLRPMAVAR